MKVIRAAKKGEEKKKNYKREKEIGLFLHFRFAYTVIYSMIGTQQQWVVLFVDKMSFWQIQTVTDQKTST